MSKDFVDARAVTKLESYYSKELKLVNLIGIRPSEAKIKERWEKLSKERERERDRIFDFTTNFYEGYCKEFQWFLKNIMVTDPNPVMQSNDYYLKIIENIALMKKTTHKKMI